MNTYTKYKLTFREPDKVKDSGIYVLIREIMPELEAIREMMKKGLRKEPRKRLNELIVDVKYPTEKLVNTVDGEN